MEALADVMQLPLSYKDGKITGYRSGTFMPMPGVTLPLEIRAAQHFAGEVVGLIAFVMGDLYLMAGHMESTNVVSAFLIDASKLSNKPEVLIHPKMDLRDVVGILKAGMVASFVHKAGKWSLLKLPK